MSQEKILSTLKDILASEFEINPDVITLEARLFEDLDLDSIDAIDMIVKMKPYLNKQVDPEMFKNVKIVKDVVDILDPLTN